MSALHRIQIVAAAFAVAAIAVPVTQAGLERSGLHNSKPLFAPLMASTMLGTGYGLVGPYAPRTGSTDELSASNELARHHVVPILSPHKGAAVPVRANWGLARALAGERFVPTSFLAPRVSPPKSSPVPRCLGGVTRTWFVPVRCSLRIAGQGSVYLAAAVADPTANAAASYADALAAAGSYGNIPTLQYLAAIAARPTLRIPTSYGQAVAAAGIYANVPTEQYLAAIAADRS